MFETIRLSDHRLAGFQVEPLLALIVGVNVFLPGCMAVPRFFSRFYRESQMDLRLTAVNELDFCRHDWNLQFYSNHFCFPQVYSQGLVTENLFGSLTSEIVLLYLTWY